MPNIDSERLTDSLRRLSGSAGTDLTAAVGETVDAVVTLFRVAGSGLMIADEENTLHYVAASNTASKAMEEVQSKTGEGPCVAAFVDNQVIRAADMRTDPRWPGVRDEFLRHDVVAVLGVPVRLDRTPVGTLDVFVTGPHEWDDSEAAALSRYADVIGATLATALAAQQAGDLAGQLQYALDYRIVIERAVGYLMAQRRLGPAAAFELLRGTARGRRRKVAEVARFLLETGALPPPRV
ncbi:GAF and ANTAR domain-containing protein [Catenuloplanes indicus]|uniref:Transcriptional regulator with GAF, ATPase, and Fis domain n=1 Tax=Catenuloplanes indicus TaxID=137267 RepID=A0AAE4AVE5_9ACTN|nr:GAF and ANTAR domain-containing protein [Catenuloplanes indicus]MDQ0364830.1 transcriptional regulator with GAF, ATPase, and Fis domain [Catenuloplanes indicus]